MIFHGIKLDYFYVKPISCHVVVNIICVGFPVNMPLQQVPFWKQTVTKLVKSGNFSVERSEAVLSLSTEGPPVCGDRIVQSFRKSFS